MEWQKYKDEFTWDGSWRDVYVLNTNVTIWQQFLDFLRSSGIPHSFGGEDNADFLGDLEAYFKERSEHGSLILSIDINGVFLNCHFFIETEIEFDLDPREVRDEDKANGVFNFMEILSETLSLPIRMTPENMEETPIFEYTPEDRTWTYIPCYGKTT
jgi:hypothetical protein